MRRCVSLSLLDVFSVLVGVVSGLLFVSLSEDIRLFACHLFSYNLRIVDRPQDVLMTVRTSSAHGMVKKNSRANSANTQTPRYALLFVFTYFDLSGSH